MPSQEYVDGGEYLPLSVWRNRGFDTERIEARTVEADKMMHPVLGLCYRVKTASMNAGSSDLRAPWRLRMKSPPLLIHMMWHSLAPRSHFRCLDLPRSLSIDGTFAPSLGGHCCARTAHIHTKDLGAVHAGGPKATSAPAQWR